MLKSLAFFLILRILMHILQEKCRKMKWPTCEGQILTFLGIGIYQNSGFPGGSEVKSPPINAGDAGSIPGSGRCSGEGNGNPLQYSCLGNSRDRGAWPSTVHGVIRVRHNLATKTTYQSPWVRERRKIEISVFLDTSHLVVQHFYIQNGLFSLFLLIVWRVPIKFICLFCKNTCDKKPVKIYFVFFVLVLKSEVHDLRVVLHSADKELSSVKLEYSLFRESQEKELNSLSERHMQVQLQLDNVR